MIKVTSNFEEVAFEFKQFGKNIGKATRSALNRTAVQGKNYANKEIRTKYNIKSSIGKRNITVSKAQGSRRYSEISAKGKRIPVAKFKTRQTKQGVNVEIRKGHKKLLKGMFIATMPATGHKGVFKRYGEKRLTHKGRYAGTNIKRQPIKERYTLSMAEMFRATKVITKIKVFVSNKFPEVLKQRLEFYNK